LEKIKCKICNKEFQNIIGLRAHIWQTHKIPIKEYYDSYMRVENEGICNVCGIETTFGGLSFGYRQTHSKCNGKDPDQIKKRVETYHLNHPKKIEIYNFKCQICNKPLKNSRSLSMHLKYNHPNINITTKDYYDTFIKKEGENICKLEGCDNLTSYQSFENGYLKHCCNSHAQKNPEIRKKLEDTKEEKYGDRNFTNRNKAKQTLKEKYGDEFYNNRPKCSESLINRSDEQKEDWKSKVRIKWNDKNEEELEDINSKRKITLKEKYGDENYQAKASFKAIKLKYGVDNSSQIPGHTKKVKETWNNKTDEEMFERSEKTRKTMMNRYGVEHIMYIEEIKQKVLQKVRQTLIRLGKWLGDDQIPLFQVYQRKVSHFTNKSIKKKFTSEDLSKTGRSGVVGALQIDHIFSVKEGFLNNILPQIIGHENNLRLIPWYENDKKKSKCDITLDQLFELTNDLLNLEDEAKGKG